MKVSSKSPYGNIDRGILQAIGLAVVNYSLLEEYLALGVSFLVTGTLPDDAAEIMVTALHFRAVLDTFGCLYRHRFPQDDFRDLTKICNELGKLNDERNHLVHSFWSSGKAADQLTRYRTAVRRGGRKKWEENVSEADVLRLAERAEETADRLLDFVASCILPRIEGVIPQRRS